MYSLKQRIVGMCKEGLGGWRMPGDLSAQLDRSYELLGRVDRDTNAFFERLAAVKDELADARHKLIIEREVTAMDTTAHVRLLNTIKLAVPVKYWKGDVDLPTMVGDMAAEIERLKRDQKDCVPREYTNVFTDDVFYSDDSYPAKEGVGFDEATTLLKKVARLKRVVKKAPKKAPKKAVKAPVKKARRR